MKIINEEWKTIERTNGNYEIINLGRVKSKERIYLSGENYRIKKKTGGKLLNQTLNKDGYPTVSLRLDDGKRHTLKVHRLVALAFIQNTKNLPQINHKDENKENNRVDNLEWCTSKYNANYGTRNKRMIKQKYLKAVIMLDLSGNELKRFESLGDASRETGFDISAIIRVCKGKQRTSMGYKWKYAD